MKSKGIVIDNEILISDVRKDGAGLITRGVKVGDVTRQNQQLIIMSSKGEIKENALKGVGAVNFINSDNAAGLTHEIKQQLKSDGMTVESVLWQNGELVIKADYE